MDHLASARPHRAADIAALPCPICGTTVPLAASERPSSAPFCSHRCRLIDLGEWAAGAYAIGGQRPALDHAGRRFGPDAEGAHGQAGQADDQDA